MTPEHTSVQAQMVGEAQRLQRQGRHADAMLAYQRILARWPALPDCWFNLGVLQRKARQLPQALASYQRALDLGITAPEEVHLNRGVIYSDHLRQDDAAERELQAALRLNPRYTPALLNLANLYEDLGRRPQAAALYERLLAVDPQCFEALARYASLLESSSETGPMAARLQAALQHPAASAADRASLGFALGRVLDGRGQYPEAFAAYTRANRDSRASAAPGSGHYDRLAQEQLVDRLIRAPVVQGSETGRPASPAPVFICGMFRSGSTLTEQLLAGDPATAAGGELDFLPRHVATDLAPFPESLASIPPERLTGLAGAYLAETAALYPGARRITDKRPDNFLYIGLIKSLFPDAKIVHTVRNPLDNCLSVFFLHLDHRMSYALDLMDIGHYFRQYRRLMAHWKQLFPADIHDFDYDAFVADPAPAARRLFEFIGSGWQDKYLELSGTGRAIKTASVWQVREPLHRRSSGRARHYAEQLQGLERYLAGMPPR